jgi:hypothetical protein
MAFLPTITSRGCLFVSSLGGLWNRDGEEVSAFIPISIDKRASPDFINRYL